MLINYKFLLFYCYIGMKVLTTSLLDQTLFIIPRKYSTSVNLTLRDETTNTSVSYVVSTTTASGGDYMSITQAFALVEGRFYEMNITEVGTNDLIYKGRIFCTDQTISQNNNDYYSVNENEYVEHSSDNDFIVL